MTFLFLYQNYFHGNDENPGNSKEGKDGSIQNQETYSGKTCQRIQLKSAMSVFMMMVQIKIHYVYKIFGFIFRY